MQNLEVTNKSRRKAIKLIGGVSALTILGAGVTISLLEPKYLSLDEVIVQLKSLQSSTIQSSGVWSADHIFNHCAQSIEMSMEGYPEHKSSLFKNTLGQSAFKVFGYQQRMTHNLSEVIPGAPAISSTSTNLALERLIAALQRFEQYQGKLAPHFAYGELSKDDYRLAHILHINNHLEEITIEAS